MIEKRILVIDDEELVRDAIGLILTRNNYAVQLAASAKDGLTLLKECKFDLIITDLVMPEIDGVSFIQQLRHNGCTTPIMTLTGGARPGQSNLSEKAKQVGASVTLQKPLNKQELLAGVDQALLFKATP